MASNPMEERNPVLEAFNLLLKDNLDLSQIPYGPVIDKLGQIVVVQPRLEPIGNLHMEVEEENPVPEDEVAPPKVEPVTSSATEALDWILGEADREKAVLAEEEKERQLEVQYGPMSKTELYLKLQSMEKDRDTARNDAARAGQASVTAEQKIKVLNKEMQELKVNSSKRIGELQNTVMRLSSTAGEAEIERLRVELARAEAEVRSLSRQASLASLPDGGPSGPVVVTLEDQLKQKDEQIKGVEARYQQLEEELRQKDRQIAEAQENPSLAEAA